MDLALITDRTVRDALGRVRGAGGLADSPLLALELVAERLRASGTSPTEESRGWALTGLLHDLALHYLTRFGSPLAAADGAAADRTRLAAAFAADCRPGSPDREAWSALYLRYLAAEPFQVQELASIVQPGSPHGRRYIARRLERGYTLLARALVDRERQAARRASPAATHAAADEQPALAPHNLPVPRTSFIGRTQAVADVRAVLAHNRLVTLTGTGGIGKTRLAIAVAEAALPDYPDGAWFVDLATVDSVEQVGAAAVAALGIRDRPGWSLTATLVGALRAQRMLLVLDNCEQVLAGAAELASAILAGTEQVHILATGRSALGVPREAVWPVPPLSVPRIERDRSTGTGAGEALAAIEGAEATRLFLARAWTEAAAPTRAPEIAAGVAAICAQLDGLPLAIELAAARTRLLSVGEIERRLGATLELLGRADPGTAPRHRTLAASLEWSHDLLSSAERLLFARLAVFHGGWTVSAAEEVCGGEGLPRSDVLDLTERLADHSLVVVETKAGGPRCRFLNTVWAFALQRLAAESETETWRQKHLAHFRRLAERAEAGLTGPEQLAWLHRLDGDADNLLAALSHALASPDEADATVRLACAMAAYWDIRGRVVEGRRLLEQALAQAPEDHPHRPHLRYWCGVFARRDGDFAAAQAHYEAALLAAEAKGDAPARAAALLGLGETARHTGDLAAAGDFLERSVATARAANDWLALGMALNNLGLLLENRGSYDAARAAYAESLATARSRGDERHASIALNNLGLLAAYQGDHATARTLLAESLATKRRLQDRWGVLASLTNLGLIAENEADWALARELYQEALASARRMGDTWGVAVLLNNLGCVAEGEGDLPTARHLHAQSLALRREMGNSQGIVYSLGNLALVLVQLDDHAEAAAALREGLQINQSLGDLRCLAVLLRGCGARALALGAHDPAARLLGAADGLARRVGLTPTRAQAEADEVQRAILRRLLGPSTADAAWAQGAALSAEEATTLALSTIEVYPQAG